MAKVSVIIPVYNTEKYLRKCLESVCQQTLKDIEIICINDCSTDHSLDILSEYAANDSRIKLIDFSENKGAAVARNTGIDAATGEYLGFVDSDDYVDLNFYEKLYDKAIETGAEAVKGNVFFYDEKCNFSYISSWYNNNDDIKKNFAAFLYGFTSSIYLLTFIRKNEINFPEHIRYFEDPYFSIKAAIKYNKLEVVNDAKYFYRKNGESVCLTIDNNEKFKCILASVKEIFKFLNESNISKANYDTVVNFLFLSLFDVKQIDNLPSQIVSNIIDGLFFIVKNYKYSDNPLFSSQLMCLLFKGNKQKQILDEYLTFIKEKYLSSFSNMHTSENIILISVVNDFNLFTKNIENNVFIKSQTNIKLFPYDNRETNEFISKRYNNFIENYDYTDSAWFIFCHTDWEPLEDINEVVNRLDKCNLYGLIGAKSDIFKGKYVTNYSGYCLERQRNGANLRVLDYPNPDQDAVDTLDCVALFVHSSLVKKYDLRFDENLAWDLYVEDFCIQAKQKFNISSYTFNMKSCHWSDASYKEIPSSYYKSLSYLNNKYKDSMYAGTCSWIGGKKGQFATLQEQVVYKAIKNIRRNK